MYLKIFTYIKLNKLLGVDIIHFKINLIKSIIYYCIIYLIYFLQIK